MIRFTQLKTGATVLLLSLSFALWVLCILCINANQTTWGTYPPAIVALMVCGIIQSVYVLGQVTLGKYGIYASRNIIIANSLFCLFAIGSVVPTTVLRHHPDYCRDDGECMGRLKGTYGVGYALIGADVLYIALIVGIVKENKLSFCVRYGAYPDSGEEVKEMPDEKL